jgi:hypothetical protein
MHDSFATLSTMCSPTELNESYVSMDPFSPYAMVGSSAKNRGQKKIPPPPLEHGLPPPGKEDKDEPPSELYCKVFQQTSPSQETTQVGFIVLNCENPTFADAREVIMEELVPDMLSEDMPWKFIVPTLGKVSQKQERLFGPLMNNTDGAMGTLENPLSLVIVETKAKGSYTSKTRMESDSTIVTRTKANSVPDTHDEGLLVQEKESSPKRQASGQQSDQAMEQKTQENRDGEEDYQQVESFGGQPKEREIYDDEASDSEKAIPIERSWTIEKMPTPVVSPPPKQSEKDKEVDSCTTSPTSESMRSMERTHLIGYNRPEVFDPPPRSPHIRESSYRSLRSEFSPRKPRGSNVAAAVNRFQPNQADRNESLLSTADSIDSTKPFVIVMDPNQEKNYEDKESKEQDIPSTIDGSNKSLSAMEPTITSKLQGFTRRFWKPKEDPAVYERQADQEGEMKIEEVHDDSHTPEDSGLIQNAESEGAVDVESDIESLPEKEGDEIPAEMDYANLSSTTLSSNKFEKEEVQDKETVAAIDHEKDDERATSNADTADEEVLEIIPVERKITKRLIMLVTLYSGNREIMPKQKRAISMLETCQIPPKIVDGSDPGNKQVRNELFEVAEMRGVYPLFFIEERDEANARAIPNVNFLGTFETIEKLKESGTLSDILKD